MNIIAPTGRHQHAIVAAEAKAAADHAHADPRRGYGKWWRR